MGELADAIREHLELKRRRGADPAEVAREEHEALTPATRSHPIVVAPSPIDERAGVRDDVAVNGSAVIRQGGAPWNEVDDDEPHDATQELRIDPLVDWLEDEA